MHGDDATVALSAIGETLLLFVIVSLKFGTSLSYSSLFENQTLFFIYLLIGTMINDRRLGRRRELTVNIWRQYNLMDDGISTESVDERINDARNRVDTDLHRSLKALIEFCSLQ
jgi:hypothetical protein